MVETENYLRELVRDVPDFPKEGIIFKDITPILKDKEAFKKLIDVLADKYKDKKIDHIVSIEARGFIFGAALAYVMNAGFVPVRKKGKLPSQTKSITYDLEYNTDTLEIHSDAVSIDENVLIVDDVLATGGTAAAVANLLKNMGCNIEGIAFFIELEFLKGKDKLKDLDVYSVIKY